MRKSLLVLLVFVVPALSFVSSWALAAATQDFQFTDVRKHTTAFHQYERTIKLTPAQQAIYREALEGLPAPCCQDNTALTCCCPCNSARAWWGLAKHLVADLGYDAKETRAKVARVVQVHQSQRLERHHLLHPRWLRQAVPPGRLRRHDRRATRLLSSPSSPTL